MQALLAPLALLVERLAGYPNAIVKRIGHPVIWIGALISLLDTRLNRDTNRRGKGVLALIILLVVTGVLAAVAAWLCRQIPYGFILEAILASTLLAQKALGDAVRTVAAALRRSLPEGRTAVSRAVRRAGIRFNRSSKRALAQPNSRWRSVLWPIIESAVLTAL